MKKILRYMTTWAVALLLMGCAQVEESAEPKGSGAQSADVVGFDVYTQRATRSGTADDVTTDNLKTGSHSADGFGVFAYYTGEDNYSLDFTPNFMYNQQVKYNSSAQKFAYEPVKYWPNEENHHVSFFAYAPWVNVTASTGAAADQTSGITGMTKNKTTGDPLIHYVATTDLSKGVDLCWDQQLNKLKPNNDSKVEFTLKHALSKLNVKVQTSVGVNASTKIYIRSITFSGFTMKGSLNLNSATAQWTAYEKGGPLNKDVITFYDGRRDGREGYVADDSELPAGLNPDLVQSTLWDDFSPKPGVTNSAQNLFTSATATDPAYVIPTGDPVDITIEYDIETADPKLKGYFLSDGKTNGTSIANRITKTNVLAKLDAGKSYTLTLNLGIQDITFDATSVSDWKIIDPLLTPLTFEAREAGATVSFNLIYTYTAGQVQYSTDDGDSWSPYTSNTVITLENVGDIVSFRNTSDNSRYGIASSGHNNGKTFTVTKNCYVYGNILSLVDYKTTLRNNATFRYLFWGCSTITNHPTLPLLLPATTLTSECYNNMFLGCSSLTMAPELPATTMALRCYNYMFMNCTSLASAPALPATTLTSECYYGMFSGCTNLTSTPELPATTLANKCYYYMFSGCTSLTTAPTLPAETLTDYCYSYMFNECTGLTTAPTLPAETLANYCYCGMFNGCTSLTTAPNLPATTLANYCYYSMFEKCTNLTVPPVLPATTLATGCYANMFRDCSNLTTAPDLPAQTLVSGCYQAMFWNCSNLNNIKCLATNIPEGSTSSWMYNIWGSGTFYINSSLNTSNPTPWTRGSSGIPNNWTIQNYTP